MRSIIPSGKKMRKRIAKYPIPNFKIQIQFLNRNGEQFAFAVKSPGRFLPFRKKNGAVRRCTSVFAAGRNIRRNGARNGINGHGLKQNLARSRHNGVEKAFSAEEHIFDSADGLNIHCAGRTHCGKIAGVYNDGLPGSEVVFNRMAVNFYESFAETAEFLHYEALTAEQPCAETLLKMDGELNRAFACKEAALLNDERVVGCDVKAAYRAGEA